MRARMVRAGVLAAQRARDRQIEDALTAAFDRQGDVRELQLALEAADRDLAAAVAALAGLGEKPEAIAEQTEMPLKEVQRLLKLAEESPAGDGAGTAPAEQMDGTGGVPVTLAG
jgi:hypothetical protein